MKILIKSGAYKGQEMEELVALAKGLIGPGDLSVGGDMKPQQAAKLISLIQADPFLSKIQSVSMSRLTRDIDVLDFAEDQLVRIPQGQEPDDADLAGLKELGSTLEAKPAQLFSTIKLDALRDYADRPDVISTVETGFATSLANSLVKLGFVGVSDDNVGATRLAKFVRLNKGWIQLAKEAADTPKVTIDPALDAWTASLAAILKASDPRILDTGTFVMNTGDADAYAMELGAHVTGTPLTADSPLRRFQGKAIEANPRMPSGYVMFTPLQNLAFGLHSDIRRDKEYHSRKRALEYTYDMAFDYEIAAKKLITLGKPA
jgi:hypothetical protein